MGGEPSPAARVNQEDRQQCLDDDDYDMRPSMPVNFVPSYRLNPVFPYSRDDMDTNSSSSNFNNEVGVGGGRGGGGGGGGGGGAGDHGLKNNGVSRENDFLCKQQQPQQLLPSSNCAAIPPTPATLAQPMQTHHRKCNHGSRWWCVGVGLQIEFITL